MPSNSITKAHKYSIIASTKSNQFATYKRADNPATHTYTHTTRKERPKTLESRDNAAHWNVINRRKRCHCTRSTFPLGRHRLSSLEQPEADNQICQLDVRCPASPARRSGGKTGTGATGATGVHVDIDIDIGIGCRCYCLTR